MLASAVGIFCWRISSFAKTLDASMRAADFIGPNARNFAAANRSTIPAASGSSGPTTVRSARFSWQDWQLQLLGVANNCEPGADTDLFSDQNFMQVMHAPDGLIIKGHDQVARTQTSTLGGTVLLD